MSTPIQLPLKVISETAVRCGMDVGPWSPTRRDIPQVATHEEVHPLIVHLQRQDPDEPLAILIGRRSPPFDFGIPSRIARHCPTLREAVERYIHFQTLVAPGCSCVEPHDEQADITVLVAPTPPMNPDIKDSRLFRSIYPMAFAVANLRRLAGDKSLSVEAVDVITGDDGDKEKYEAFFGGSLRFGEKQNRLLFSDEVLDTPVEGADPGVVPYLEKLAYKEFQQIGHRPGVNQNFEELVRSTLEDAMLDGEHDLSDLAQTLNMSERTLQRRLKEEGLSYRELVDEVRMELAMELLRAPEHTLQCIAHKLGYNHIASFTRAFKRWTGRPPGEFRSVFVDDT